MKRTIIPGARTGRVRIPASKSQAHRLLICAALGEEKTEVVCDGISADIAATAKCLSALGAKIEEMETGFLVSPIKKVPEGRCDLYCGESGSTLRFLLPIAGALGAQAVFHREGRLPQRPLAPLDSVLKEHGMTLREDGDLLYCSGQLIGGNYTIAGNVSSQYISGLLMALPLLIRDSLLMVSGPLESAAYVAMTEDALQLSKLTIPKMGAMWAIPGQQRCHLPKRTGNLKLSLLAVRQIAGKNVALLFQTENIKQFLGLITHARFVGVVDRQAQHAFRRRAAVFRTVMKSDHNVADHRHIVEKTDILESTRDTLMIDDLLGLAGKILAVQVKFTVGRLIHAGNHIEHGGLSGAVRADKTVKFLFFNGDIDILRRF